MTRSGKRWYKLRYALTHNRPFHVEKVKNDCIFFGLVLHLWFLFFLISLTEMLISMNKVEKIHNFESFSASSFNEVKHFKGCFLCYVNQSSWKLSICKCVIISITVRATELYHIPNKSLCCGAFQPYIKLNLWFLWHIAPFLRAGHIYVWSWDGTDAALQLVCILQGPIS